MVKNVLLSSALLSTFVSHFIIWFRRNVFFFRFRFRNRLCFTAGCSGYAAAVFCRFILRLPATKKQSRSQQLPESTINNICLKVIGWLATTTRPIFARRQLRMGISLVDNGFKLFIIGIEIGKAYFWNNTLPFFMLTNGKIKVLSPLSGKLRRLICWLSIASKCSVLVGQFNCWFV